MGREPPRIRDVIIPAIVTSSDRPLGFKAMRDYDATKVQATFNEIDGYASTDNAHAHYVGTPTVFGMNFQSVSVGQKLAKQLF